MSISAVRSIQGQYAVQPVENRRKPGATQPSNKNTGPDTVSISPEALALSEANRANTLQMDAQPEHDNGAVLPGWLADLLSGSAAVGLSGLKDMLGSENGVAAFGKNEFDQQDWEQLGQKLADILNTHGISSAGDMPKGDTAANAFGKILQQELFKAISADPRFAGAAVGMTRQG